ncbi:24516_t:CDS:2 [Dentiscutata erythropus]|uniref:24516_t:CDS:1 n=1 Tax=Dentiscutata erythropus TaxID=1348616 RepID=A0A9N8ZZ52_9GLOM|nr:24516_t:CDS:2 [Dentiscutata erythropus]
MLQIEQLTAENVSLKEELEILTAENFSLGEELKSAKVTKQSNAFLLPGLILLDQLKLYHFTILQRVYGILRTFNKQNYDIGLMLGEISHGHETHIHSIEDRNKLRKGAEDSFDTKKYMNYEYEEDEDDEGSENYESENYESKNYESEDNKSKDEESECYENKNNEDEDKENEFDELENLTSRSGLNDYNVPTFNTPILQKKKKKDKQRRLISDLYC